MAVYYFEGSEILAPLRITSNSPVYESDTVSLKRVKASQEAQRWEMSFEVLTADNAVDILMAGITDPHLVKTMVMPQIEEASTVSVSLVVSSTAGVSGASSISMNGSGTVKKGRFIKFSDHDKVYITAADVTVAPNVVLTGSINPTASTAVVGVGTLFSSELSLGDKILVSGEERVVATITDNTHLTVTVAFTDVANDAAPKKVVFTSISVFPSLQSSCVKGTVLSINPSILYHRNNSDIQGITFQDGVLASPGSISLVEAL